MVDRLMIHFRQIFIIILSVWCIDIIAQQPAQQGWVDQTITLLRMDEGMNSLEKSDLADSAYHIALREGNLCARINFRILQATFLDNMGKADSALALLYWANRMYDKSCDSMLLMQLFSNLTNVY